MPTPDSALSTALLDALPDPSLLIDSGDGWQIRAANPAALAAFGVRSGDRLDQALPDLWPELAPHTADWSGLRAGDTHTLHLQGTARHGWVEVRAFRVGDLLGVQLIDRTAERAAEARSDALSGLTFALSKALTSQEAATVALKQGLTALDATTGSVFVLDLAADELVLAETIGHEETDMQGWRRFPASAPTLLGDALRAGEPLFLSAAEVDALSPHLGVQRTTPIRAVAALPLLFCGRAVGVMDLGFAEERAFGRAERHILLALADQLSQALERIRLWTEERRARETNALLYELTAALGQADTPGAVAGVIARGSVPALGATGGVMLELDRAREELVVLSEDGVLPAPLAAGRFSLHLDVSSAACARTGQAQFLGTPEFQERYPHLQNQTPTQAAASLPLIGGGQLLGVLAYGWHDAHVFTDAERALLTALAGQCAGALERTRRAEAERAQAQLLDLAQDAVIVRTLASEVTYWNPASEALYGYPARDVRGQVTHTLLQTQFPESRAAVDEALLAGNVWEGELRHTARGGRAVIVSSRQTLRRNERGEPVAILEINRDMSAKRAAQSAQEASEERYRALTLATNQYVWTNSAEGEMVGEQPGWARLTGQSEDEYRGFGWSACLHPADLERAVDAWHEAVRTRSLYEVEQQVRGADGTYRAFLVRAIPLLDADGRLREWVGLHSDVTDLKRAEQTLQTWGHELERQVAVQTRELRAANEELGAFAYTVSHDLRTPVRHVGSFAELLRRKVGDDPGALRYLDVIDGAASRMSTLIDALLGLARAGTTELKIADVDLQGLVESVRQELAAEVSGREVVWRLGDLPAVRADPGLLRPVVANLLGNAVKYSRNREKAVVEVWALESAREVTVAVRDNGAGFDPQYAGKLFGVFQRLHTEREFEGTGVGLANVKRIVEKHGGQVWAEGRPGEGATFFFSLPRA